MKNLYNAVISGCSKLLLILVLLSSFKSQAQQSMRANLYVLDATGPILMDGNFTEYNNVYSNDVDIYDAWKMANPGANFGIFRSNYNLAVERRNVIGNTDTTFFRMWNMPKTDYSIKLTLVDMGRTGMQCFLKDSYLGTKTIVDLNGITDIKFSVNNDPASAAEMRFQLVYVIDMPSPVEVSFKSVQADRSGADVLVKWDVSNEITVLSYTVEYSTDAINFTGLDQIIADHNNTNIRSYNYRHLSVPVGTNFYRIKATNTGSRVQYSAVVKVKERYAASGISVYPNPVINKIVQLGFDNVPAGTYRIVLLYNNGVQQPLASIQLTEGQRNGSVNLPQNLAPGIYRLQFTGPGNARIIKTINVL